MAGSVDRRAGWRRRTIMGVIRDYPGLCTFLLLVLVGVHALVATKWWPPARLLARMATSGGAPNIYASMTQFAGITAGFAGVVIIFGLQGSSVRIRRFRWAGGPRLQANWISIIATSFVAGFAVVGAAVLDSSGKQVLATWAFEASLVLLAHSCLRMMWLLRSLAILVMADDKQSEGDLRAVDPATLFTSSGAPAPHPPHALADFDQWSEQYPADR